MNSKKNSGGFMNIYIKKITEKLNMLIKNYNAHVRDLIKRIGEILVKPKK
jgi:hypothetical protein